LAMNELSSIECKPGFWRKSAIPEVSAVSNIEVAIFTVDAQNRTIGQTVITWVAIDMVGYPSSLVSLLIVILCQQLITISTSSTLTLEALVFDIVVCGEPAHTTPLVRELELRRNATAFRAGKHPATPLSGHHGAFYRLSNATPTPRPAPIAIAFTASRAGTQGSIPNGHHIASRNAASAKMPTSSTAACFRSWVSAWPWMALASFSDRLRSFRSSLSSTLSARRALAIEQRSALLMTFSKGTVVVPGTGLQPRIPKRSACPDGRAVKPVSTVRVNSRTWEANYPQETTRAHHGVLSCWLAMKPIRTGALLWITANELVGWRSIFQRAERTC
jgi:hypothetical protein